MKTISPRICKLIAAVRNHCLIGLLAWCASAAAQDTPATTATNTSDADKAWRETYEAMQSPLPPKEWADKKPTRQELVDFYEPLLLKGADKAKDFYTRFPDHPKAASARSAEYNMLSLVVEQFGDTNQTARLAELQKERLNDPSLSEDERFGLRMQAAQQLLRQSPVDMDKFLNEAHALQKDFPKHDEVYELLLMAASSSDGDTARKIAQEIIAGSAPEPAKVQARGLLNRLGALGKPVNIQYTAIDGRPVDLAKLKGKVVLIDFWATWCAPCVGEVPDVKAAYEKLHAKGFEIVGISLDEDKDALAGFVKDNGMPWPQYFDGSRWSNKFAQQFGIDAIPAMWLVDKQGNLRDQNARGALEEKVIKLLAE